MIVPFSAIDGRTVTALCSQTAVKGKRVQFNLFLKESYRGIWINEIVPEPHL